MKDDYAKHEWIARWDEKEGLIFERCLASRVGKDANYEDVRVTDTQFSAGDEVGGWIPSHGAFRKCTIDEPREIGGPFVESSDDGLRLNIHKGLQGFVRDRLWQTIVDAAKK